MLMDRQTVEVCVCVVIPEPISIRIRIPLLPNVIDGIGCCYYYGLYGTMLAAAWPINLQSDGGGIPTPP